MSIANQPYEQLANRAHIAVLVNQTGHMGMLGDLELKMDAMRSTENALTDPELEKKFKHLSKQGLADAIKRMEASRSLAIADGGVKIRKNIAEMKAEQERRQRSSKVWLKQSFVNQAEFMAGGTEDDLLEPETAERGAEGEEMRGKSSAGSGVVTLPSNGLKTPDESNTRPVTDRARRQPFKSQGMASLGAKQVEAAQNGPTKRRQTGANGKLAAGPTLLTSRLGGLRGSLPLTRSTQGEQQQSTAQRAGDKQCINCQLYKGRGRMLDNKVFICGECHDAQEAAEKGAQTRNRTRAAAHGAGDDGSDFERDTRRIQEPRLKQSGLATSTFYGASTGAAASAAPQAEGAGREGGTQTYSRSRLSLRKPKRKAEEDNEPITLDDTDDEEAGPGPGSVADAAQPRRSQRSNAFKGPTQRFQGLKALYPPCGGPGAVEITPADLARLDPEEFLNDTIIDFFMRYIWEHLSEAVKARCYFFNSFFWKKLTEKTGLSSSLDNGPRGSVAAANHERVKKWTKGLDIFERDFLFVPIHDHLHWSLLVVCNPGADPDDPTRTPCMLHLDSMTGGHSTPGLKKAVGNFLAQEWDRKVSEGGDSVPAKWVAAHPDAPLRSFELQAKKVKLPMQDNYCDCGLFLLTYVDFFTHGLPETLRLTIHPKKNLDPEELGSLSTYPLFLQQQWFFPGNASKLRNHLRYMLLGLFIEQVPEDQRDSRGDAMAEAFQDRTMYEEASPVDKYLGPAEYLPRGLERLEAQKKEQERQRLEKARLAEEKQRKAAELRERSEQRRGLSQPSSQPGASGDADSPRRRAADAAERRFARRASSAEDNLEIDLANSPRESSESPSNPFDQYQFRVHSRTQDGPLGANKASLDDAPGNICKQEVQWRSKRNSIGVKKGVLLDDYSSEDDRGADVRCTREIQSIDLEGDPGSPTAAGSAPEKAPGRVETPAMAERYEAHFRLHKRYSSDDDRLAHVEVEVLPPRGQQICTINAAAGTREQFGSEESAYDWMDAKLKEMTFGLSLPVTRKAAAAALQGVSQDPTYGIPDWSSQPSAPAVKSTHMPAAVDAPRGRVSDRTRNAPSRSGRQQASGGTARDSGLSNANSRGQQGDVDAPVAHDLTEDDDLVSEASQPAPLAGSTLTTDDAFAAANERAYAAIAAVTRTLGGLPCDSSEPASDADTAGLPSWLGSDPAEASKDSMAWALAEANKIALPEDAHAQTSPQASSPPAKQGAGKSSNWNYGIGRLRKLLPQKILGVKLPSIAHVEGFTTTDEEEEEELHVAADGMAQADEPTSRAQIDLTSEDGRSPGAAATGSPAVQQAGSSCQEGDTAGGAAAAQLPAHEGDLGSPKANGDTDAGMADLSYEDRARLRRRNKKRRHRENQRRKRDAGSQNPVTTIEEQQSVGSSDDDGEVDIDDGSPSVPDIDPVLAVDVEADPPSPTAAVQPPTLPKVDQVEADAEMARWVQRRLDAEQEGQELMSELSDMHLDGDDGSKDKDYVPGKEGGKRGKRKGKCSPKKPSPKKAKPSRNAAFGACAEAAVASMRASPSAGPKQTSMDRYWGYLIASPKVKPPRM